MNVLDSNVEALAFNYLSFGLLTALNNLWTWLALLTAAFSFWKIRSTGCLKPEPKPEAQVQAQPYIRPDRVADLLTVEKTEPTQQDAVLVPFSPSLLQGENGARKGKFTVYYEKDMDMQGTCGEREGLLTAWEEKEGTETEWWKRWERLLRLRNGENENGWYTWQDLTELNGNVVRFWDCGLSGSFVRESWYNSNSNSSCIHVW